MEKEGGEESLTDNVKYKINTYVQLLKYVDDGDERSAIISQIKELLDLVPDVGYSDSFIGEVYDDYMESDIRKMLICISNMGITRMISTSEMKSIAYEQGIKISEPIEAIGHFVRRYKNSLLNEDGIDIKIKRRGTGSNLYRFNKEK